jgi:hypothetical protein
MIPKGKAPKEQHQKAKKKRPKQKKSHGNASCTTDQPRLI